MPLTIEDVKMVVEELAAKTVEKPLIIVNLDLLNTTQTIVKCGNYLYYPADIKEGEIKLIDISDLPIEDKMQLKYE